MGVIKRNMDIIVNNDRDRQRVLSVLNNTDKPSQCVINKFAEAMKIKVEETFLTGGR